MVSNHQCVYSSMNVPSVNGFYMAKCGICGNIKACTRLELETLQERKTDMPDFFKDLFK